MRLIKQKQSTQEKVQEIHSKFYSATQQLYNSARQMNKIETQKQDLIDKAERLRKIGFENTQEIKTAQREIERLEDKKKDNSNKQEIIDAINYFSFKYPHYKFITENSVKRICKDYGLIYGSIDLYIGTVPDKNLKQLEEFKISDEDKAYEEVDEIHMGFGEKTVHKRLINYKDYVRREEEKTTDIGNMSTEMLEMRMRAARSRSREYIQQSPLEIAASSKDFDLKQMEVEDFKITNKPIPDPVVLQPVLYNMNKYYLVVTAWGDEAEDSKILNEKHN